MVQSLRQIGLSVASGFEWQALDEPTKRGLTRAAVTAEQIDEDASRTQRRSSAAGAIRWVAAVPATTWRCTPPLPHICSRQCVRGAVLSEYPRRRPEPAAVRREQVRAAFRERPDPARVGVLQPGHVRRQGVLHRERLQALHDRQHDRRAEDRRGCSITIYIQHENPGADKQSNWPPAPADGSTARHDSACHR